MRESGSLVSRNVGKLSIAEQVTVGVLDGESVPAKHVLQSRGFELGNADVTLSSSVGCDASKIAGDFWEDRRVRALLCLLIEAVVTGAVSRDELGDSDGPLGLWSVI